MSKSVKESTRPPLALPIRPGPSSNPKLPVRRNTTNSSEHVCDVIYENQRGTAFFQRLKFSRRFLLPTDYRAFSKENGDFAVEKEFYQCPPTWEWISDWIIDMSGDVDPEGWSYATHFGSERWSGQPNMTHYVRRKKWIRMRRQKSQLSSASLDQSMTGSPVIGSRYSYTTLTQQNILKALQAVGNDRLKLLLLQKHLSSKSNEIDREIVIGQILDQFEFDSGKLKAAILFAPVLTKIPSSSQKSQTKQKEPQTPPPLPKHFDIPSIRMSLLRTILSKLSFTVDKLAFLRTSGFSDEHIARILYPPIPV